MIELTILVTLNIYWEYLETFPLRFLMRVLLDSEPKMDVFQYIVHILSIQKPIYQSFNYMASISTFKAINNKVSQQQYW